MPETEPKPKLIEAAGAGSGQGWKAVLKSGKPVVVHEIPVPPAEAAAAVPRLQRLYEHRHPALSPVLGWGTDASGIWVAVEPNEGTPLGSMLSRGPLTPPAAAALGAAVLSGVAALHEAGIALGGFNASAIRVTSNGDVRLAGHPAAAVRGAPSQSDLRADVRSCGMAVCAAFGVDPAGAPAPPNIPPGLVVTMRSMASGAMGPAADRAMGALREMASALLAPDRQVAAQSELALRAGGREVPPITPFLPQEQAAAAAAPAAAPAPPAPRPATYVPPTRREETPVRTPVSYDAPDRPLQTYPSMPAYQPSSLPVAPPPAPAPLAPAASAAPAVVTPPSVPVELPKPASVPTWADAQEPARTAAPWETSTSSANAPADAPPPPPPPPAAAPPPPPPAPVATPPAEPVRFPESPAPIFASAPPPPAAPAASMPAAEPAGLAVDAASAPPDQAKPAWSTVAPAVWTPGGLVSPPAAAATATNPPAPRATVAPAPARVETSPPIPRKPSVARPGLPGGLLSERPPWLVPAAVAAIVVLLLGVGGIFLLANHGKSPAGGGTASTSPSAHPTSSPKSSPSATANGPLAVPVYGPASAAPITKVVICSTTTPCAIPGSAAETATACDLSSCHVEVGIYFSSGQRTPVSYLIKFFDRCTGVTTDLPGPNAYTPPGYAIVIPADHWPVTLPANVKSGAIVAVSQTPAVVASAPLLVGADSCA